MCWRKERRGPALHAQIWQRVSLTLSVDTKLDTSPQFILILCAQLCEVGSVHPHFTDGETEGSLEHWHALPTVTCQASSRVEILSLSLPVSRQAPGPNPCFWRPGKSSFSQETLPPSAAKIPLGLNLPTPGSWGIKTLDYVSLNCSSIFTLWKLTLDSKCLEIYIKVRQMVFWDQSPANTGLGGLHLIPSPNLGRGAKE